MKKKNKNPVISVGTPPSKNTWHALSSGSPSSGPSYKAHMAHLLYPDCLKEEQTTLTKHRHPDGFHKCVRS